MACDGDVLNSILHRAPCGLPPCVSFSNSLDIAHAYATGGMGDSAKSIPTHCAAWRESSQASSSMPGILSVDGVAVSDLCGSVP